MNAKDDGTALCAQVFDRLIEKGGDLGGDRVDGARLRRAESSREGEGTLSGFLSDRHLSEHLGSCVTCFRTLTDLRDAPRVAEALRADPAPVPRPDDRFWEDLAQRTVAATEAAMRAPAAPAPRRAVPARARWWRGSLGSRAGVSSLTAALAAAAAWVIVARHAPVVSPVTGDRPVATEKGTASPTAYAPGEDGADETADVADLDTGTLRRLLDQVRAHAPAALASGGESSDNGEVVDDEARVNDEVADLDQDELRRVASSLEGERL